MQDEATIALLDSGESHTGQGSDRMQTGAPIRNQSRALIRGLIEGDLISVTGPEASEGDAQNENHRTYNEPEGLEAIGP